MNYPRLTLRVKLTEYGWCVYRDDQLVESGHTTEAQARRAARGLLPSMPHGFRLRWERISEHESKAEVEVRNG